MHLLTLNTAARRRKQPLQIAAIAELAPDVLCLQEVIPSTLEVFKKRLPEIGLPHLVHNEFSGAPSKARGYTLLMASKYPLEKHEHLHPLPWPEKYLRARIQAEGKEIELSTAHIPPGSSNGWVKIDTLRAVYHNLRLSPARLKILCGDFNTPKQEFPDGSIMTWGQKIRKNGTVYTRRNNEAWDQGERLILQGLREFGMVDAFRHLHGYQKEAFSFGLKRNGRVFKRRFDHIFASESLGVQECRYIHRFRDERWSDHAGMLAVFA